MTAIEQRILRAVVKLVHVRKWRPGVIYLSAADYSQLGRDRVDGLPVRQCKGKYSRLLADHHHSGVSI